ncbi:MAG: putative transcriptional regulator, IclR family [Microvirga sp.]|nr:putative transcriptional regulator, IclR family [Microvirga sp.]
MLALERREWGVTELAKQLKLSKSVVHGLLVTLQDKDFVSGDATTRRYRLGLKAISLGAGFDLNQELRAVALPLMRDLTRAAGEASYLMIRQGTMAITVARALTNGPMRISVEEGAATALHAGASGKVILAFSPPGVAAAILEQTGMPRIASQTITARDQLDENLQQIRQAGYAYSESEGMEGVFAFAAPVVGPNGLIASLGLAGVAIGIQDRYESLLSLLLEHAHRLTQNLGVSDGPLRVPSPRPRSKEKA